jgi:uncharacterized membrane protein ArfC
MNHANGWLLVVAFALGLVLTFAFMIRRVTREVPVYGPLGRGPAVDSATTAATAPAFTLAGTGDFEIADLEPYGDGSVRLERGSQTGPPGYPIKGNEDSMRYHTTDSPAYAQTMAEVWFSDEETATRAGFEPWQQNQE